MTGLPRVSLQTQIASAGRAIGRLDGTSPNPITEGQIALEIRDLTAIEATLRWLAEHQDVIVAAVKAAKGGTA